MNKISTNKNMKKIMLFILLSLLILTGCGNSGNDGYSKGLSLKLVKDYYVVDGIGSCKDENIVIPSEYKGLPVISIENKAFKDCTKIKSIVVPKSVTSIDYDVFGGCNSLESITLPFVGAFANGTKNTNFGFIFGAAYYIENNDYVPASLKEVTITGSISIAENAFNNCLNIEKITLPNSITKIGVSAFLNCKFKKIIIPSSVEKIEASVFSNCENLEEVIIEENSKLSSIDTLAFFNNKNLKKIIIPSSVKNMGFGIFYKCPNLTIYCEEEAKPSGWSANWNNSNCSVVWGYKEK